MSLLRGGWQLDDVPVLLTKLRHLCKGLNTAIEFLADAAVPDRHPLVGKAKDVAAGGMPVAAANAVVFGGRL